LPTMETMGSMLFARRPYATDFSHTVNAAPSRGGLSTVIIPLSLFMICAEIASVARCRAARRRNR
jgi:hypothetical protein